MPKLHKREIIRLDPDEVANLLDYVEHGGDEMTGMKKVYFERNKIRNLALFTLLLGTGIRVSECVGLDIEDVDFDNNRLQQKKVMNMLCFYPFKKDVSVYSQSKI